MATQAQMEIDEIDSLLGEDEPRKRRVESPMPRVSPMPQIGSPDLGPRDPLGAPEAFSREPSASPDVVDVGSRGGAQTQPFGPNDPWQRTEENPLGISLPYNPERDGPLSDYGKPGMAGAAQQTVTPPTGALAPRPAAPTSAPDVGTGVTSPRSTGAGATNPQDAYNDLTGSIDPNASQADMEAAIDAAYRDVPGYEGAYKESVKINGKWYDLVGGYGGPNATFHGMMGKTGGTAGAFSAGMFPEGGGVPQIDNTSRLDQILASIDAMARGEGSPLMKQSIDELLGGGGAVATPESVTPFVDQSAPMARQASRRVPGARIG